MCAAAPPLRLDDSADLVDLGGQLLGGISDRSAQDAVAGLDTLCHEEAWFTITVVRSDTSKHLEGNITQLTSMCLDAFFGANPLGADKHFGEGGCEVKLHGSGETITVVAVLGCIVADEPALKEMLACTGHAGTKPCVLCLNAVPNKQPRSDHGLWESSDYLCSIAEPDIGKFKLHTDASIRAAVTKISESRRFFQANI